MGLLLTAMLFSFSLFGQNGYAIEVVVDDYTEQKIFLAEQYGAQQFIIDSALVQDGKFLLQGEQSLPEGSYYVVLLPDNEILEILVDRNNQKFSLHTNLDYPSFQMEVSGSPLNTDYYEYIRFLAERRVKSEAAQDEIVKARKANDQELEQSMKAVLNELDESVAEKQIELIEKNAGSILATIIKANLPQAFPDFSNEEYPRYAEFLYTKSHFFDNVNLKDARLLRTSILSEKIDFYLNKLTHPEPDSINISLDYFLSKFSDTPETFEYYLIHFLNQYASAPQIGMDAVYVHLADNYFAKDKAKFADEEQVKKIVKEADDMRATLIGKVAPDIGLQEIDYKATLKVKDKKDEKKRWVTKREFSLHEIEAAYTVLFLWSPTCDHCKKSMPDVKQFYNNYKSKGVELVAICNQSYKGMPLCAEYIEEKEIFHWINGVDPYLKSRYKQLYNVRTYPQLFILDKNKKIVMKQFDASQLSGIMDNVLAGEI